MTEKELIKLSSIIIEKSTPTEKLPSQMLRFDNFRVIGVRELLEILRGFQEDNKTT